MAMLTNQMVISEFRGSMSPIFVEIGLHTFVNGCAIGKKNDLQGFLKKNNL